MTQPLQPCCNLKICNTCSSAGSKPALQMTVQLLEPDVAVDASGVNGFWTLIYDQVRVRAR